MEKIDYALSGLILIIVSIIFALDLLTPLGMATWALYLLPLGLSRWAAFEALVFIVAGICTVLIVVGYFFSPAGPLSEIASVNRVLGILMLWIVAFFLNVDRM
jgi:hypothetical protein